MCLTDTKDLAVDPAKTVEDTQQTRESIISYTNSLLLRVSYTICPPVSSISHAYLLPFLHLCPIRLLSMPSPLTKMQSLSGSFYPKHFLKLLSAYLYPCAAPLLSQSFTLSTSLSLSPTFSLSPLTLCLTLSLSIPSQQLDCPWVRVNNVGPHGALRSPSREGREHQRTPITQCFELGCGIKGSLTHG